MTRKNRRSSSATVAHINRRGFSLIEAAIVLAVVGEVIGGIWSAASAVRENWLAGKTEAGIELIVASLQTKLSLSESIQAGVGNLNTYAIAAGIYPTDWVNGTTVQSPYGKSVVHIWNGGNGGFDFHVQVATKSQCYRLLTALYKRKGILGMHYLQTDTDPRDLLQFSTSPSQTSCAEKDARVIVTFFFNQHN